MALVALAALAFPLAAAAQSTTTFVSNSNQLHYGILRIEQYGAQRFTTGSHANGYDLSGVRLMFGPGYLFISLSVCMTDTRGFPTSSCTPLTFEQEWTGGRRGSGIPVNPGLYTAPANTVLHPNTTYTVLVRPRNLVDLPVTLSNDNDAGASPGWSIGDTFDCFHCEWRGLPYTWESADHDPASLKIQILGTERPDPIVAAVSSVAVTSTPLLTSSGARSPDTYAVGEPIYFTVTFSEEVTVTGAPELEFSLGNPGESGNTARRAAYDAGRSTPRKLVFGYTVQATDEDTNGIWIGDQTRTFQLDGDDGILTAASGVAASLDHRGLGTQPAHKVDGARSPSADQELDPPLTATLSGVPAEHDGRTAFKLTLTFSEQVGMSYLLVRDKLFTVGGATITGTRRLDRRSDRRYELTVRPRGRGAVTLARAALPACGESDTICTADGRALEGPGALTVPGPAMLSVEDATVEEGPGAELAFAVTLNRERHAAVTVSYATSDGSATAGQDYTPVSGTLTFAAGETAKSVSVAVLDDSDVEGVETFTLSLSGASGARIADGEGVGTIENPASEMEARFLASLSGPAGHDGRNPFKLALSFSEEADMSYKTVRDNLFTVSGGTISGVRRLNPPSNLGYEVTVQPGGNDPVTLARAALPACGQSSSICTSDGRALEGPPALTVPGPAVPLTASLSGVPAEHDGQTPFKLTLTFSEEVGMSYKTVRDNLFTVGGGTIPGVRRLNPPSNLRYEVTVRPSGNDAVTLERAALPACGQRGSICTPGGRALEGEISAAVPGPAGLSVADAWVDEAENATVDFAVTLSRASTETVTVAYETSDGTATHGDDYVAASGTLSFPPGETEKTVSVTVLDDDLDEGEETFTLMLSNPSGGNAFLADASATGTINNTDPMPKAWLARFGRTVGSQVVEAVSARVDGSPPGSHVNVGGVSLGGGAPLGDHTEPLTPGDWLARQMAEGPDTSHPQERTLTGRDLLLGSSFHLVSQAGEDRGAVWSAWGRVGSGGFRAEVDGVTMDGDVVSGLLGFDAEWQRLLAGVLVLRSEAEGAYGMRDGGGSGSIDSTLTGVYPYARLRLGGRLSAWAVAGAGAGDLRLVQGAAVYDTGLDVRLGALGVRGALPVVGGFDLSVKSDVLWVDTDSDATAGLAAASARVSRLRLILEGGRTATLASGAVLAPTLQVGLRHDGGDAETGTGVEVGAGVRYSAGILSVDGQVRTLLAHEAGGYEEWGASGTIRLSPGASGLGPSLAVLPSWGAAGSGVERLWSQPDASALVPGGATSAAATRLDAELGYGLPALRGRGVLTPYARSAWAEDGNQSWHLGTRLVLAESLDVSLEGSRRQAGGGTAHDLTLRATTPW